MYRGLWSGSLCSYIAYYSDDMCAKISCLDGILRGNLDISSCDSSNAERIFDWLHHIVPAHYHDVVDVLIEQCRSDVIVPSPDKNSFFVYSNKRGVPVEYSGTVLTTSLNNIATSLICLMIYFSSRSMTMEDLVASIPRLAATVGFKVTFERVDVLEDYQFLKTSPTMHNNDIIWSLNLGVLLRAVGSFDGDLPGRGDLRKRCFEHTSSVVSSLRVLGKHCIADALSAVFHANARTVYRGSYITTLDIVGHEHVPVEFILNRYRLVPADVEALLSMCVSEWYGVVHFHPAIESIMKKDYGLTLPSCSLPV